VSAKGGASLCAALALLRPLPLPAQGDWVSEPAVQKRLAAGEIVVVEAGNSVDASRPRGSVQAAVRIPATPEAVWRVMTDCRQATIFVPGLQRCHLVARAADGRWEEIEQEVRYSWLLPAVRYVFRAEYDRPRRMDFRRVSGDLKEEEGAWLLTATADGSATVVEYEVYLDPGFWIPQFLVTRTLRKDVPAVLSGLRECVERARANTPVTQAGH
jgi:uncharacterized protein YndB with AHSA1/START domain